VEYRSCTRSCKPYQHFLNRTPLFVNDEWEGNQEEGEPEYLPTFTILFFAFGKNSKGELQFIVIHFHYSTKIRQIKILLFHYGKGLSALQGIV
jgi:hypothetical protein